MGKYWLLTEVRANLGKLATAFHGLAAVLLVLAAVVGVYALYGRPGIRAEVYPGVSVVGDKLKFDGRGYLPLDGFAVRVLTLEEYGDGTDPGLAVVLALAPSPSDFPLLLEYNRTAFDISDNPVVVIRIGDARILYQGEAQNHRVQAVVINSDRSRTVYFADGGSKQVTEAEWNAKFRRPPEAPAPPPSASLPPVGASRWCGLTSGQ